MTCACTINEQVAMEGNHVELVYNLQNKGRTTLKSVAVSENLITGLEKQCTFYGNGDSLYSTGTNHP